MNAKELRIGNLVRDNDNGGVWDLELWDYKENTFELYEPIELTEEWLLRLGFERFKGLWTIDNFPPCFTKFTHEIGLYEFFIGRISITKIKYVHQLQNLYFSLTGQELELKTDNL